jgi:hypothetical protein
MSAKSAVPATAALIFSLLSGCSGEKKAAAPPRPGTLAHSWYMAGETYKAGDYARSMQYLSEVAVKPSEYRDPARHWLIVVAGGVASGYSELADAYDKASLAGKANYADYRKRMNEIRNTANAAAIQFAETVNEVLDKNKDPKFVFDFGFPTGSAAEPMLFTRVSKGLSLQQADHDVLRRDMARRGVVKFAEALAGASGDSAKAQGQFANPPRDSALAAIANNLISVSDLYSQKKLDMPRRGNALCKEAMETLALLPDGKERKQIESKAKEELKRFKVDA